MYSIHRYRTEQPDVFVELILQNFSQSLCLGNTRDIFCHVNQLSFDILICSKEEKEDHEASYS